MTKYVYHFSEGDGLQKNLLGGKGANLSEMTKLGIPVPPGFTVTTEACNGFLERDKQFPVGMWEEVLVGITNIEKSLGKGFGDSQDPLLVSVRSGAPVSMPGMMDTILNLGLNNETVQGLAKKTGNTRFAYDSYRRFIQMFGNVVLGIASEKFEAVIEEVKKFVEKKEDTDLTADDWKQVIQKYLLLREH